MIILIGPIIEELIFRKIILKGLCQKYSKVTALIISSLIFAMCHGSLQNIIGVIPISFVLGYIYIKKSSIILCITTHAFHNILCLSIDN